MTNQYEKAVFRLPFDSQFRCFSFRYDEQTVLPLRRTIRTPLDLKKWAVIKNPIAIYCTRAKYLQAKNLGQARTGLSRSIFLSGDVVLDLDDKDFSSPEKCTAEMLKARAWLVGRFPACASWTVHSGRGWHIWIFDAFKPDPADDPRQRETKFRIFLSKLLKEMRNAGINMGNASREQLRTFLNPRQIFRVPGSFNHRNGTIVSIIPSLEKRAQPISQMSPQKNTMRARDGFEAAGPMMNASPKGEKAGRLGNSRVRPLSAALQEPMLPVNRGGP